MGYYDDKFEIKYMEIKFMNEIVDEIVEIQEFMDEDGTIYTTVYDRDKVNSFQQIREDLSLFGECPEILD